jgi:hypothetical protein
MTGLAACCRCDKKTVRQVTDLVLDLIFEVGATHR